MYANLYFCLIDVKKLKLCHVKAKCFIFFIELTKNWNTYGNDDLKLLLGIANYF